MKFLPKTLPKFYKECLSEWASYKETHISNPSNVLNEIFGTISSFVQVENHCLEKKIAEKGIIKLCDLFNDTGKLKTWDVLKTKI